MGLLLLMSGFGLLALPAAMRSLGRRLPPDRWAKLCLAALVGGAMTVEAAAVLYSLPTVLRAVGVPALARVCQRVLGPLVPGGPAAGWAAAVGAVTIAALAYLGTLRARRSRVAVHVEASLGEHRPYGGYEVVVLPTDRIVAVSVPGQPDQVLVSRGLVERLPAAQLAALVRHEVAHLEQRHHRYLRTAVAVEYGFAFAPFARRSTAALRTALERWADEVAAGDSVRARQEVSAALVMVGDAMLAPTLAAFSALQTVLERLEALQHPPAPLSARARVALYAPGAALSSMALIGWAAWGVNARLVLAVAGRCLE
jgi:Zn-dependent protease with chaperone function